MPIKNNCPKKEGRAKKHRKYLVFRFVTSNLFQSVLFFSIILWRRCISCKILKISYFLKLFLNYSIFQIENLFWVFARRQTRTGVCLAWKGRKIEAPYNKVHHVMKGILMKRCFLLLFTNFMLTIDIST